MFQDSDQRRLIDAVSDIFRLITMDYYKEYVKKKSGRRKAFLSSLLIYTNKTQSTIDRSNLYLQESHCWHSSLYVMFFRLSVPVFLKIILVWIFLSFFVNHCFICRPLRFYCAGGC